MVRTSRWAHLALGLAAAAVLAAPAHATTLVRMGLEDLTATNEMVVVGRVVDVHSHWNGDGTFILTDVRIAVDDVLKGRRPSSDVTFTVMGGTVGDKTVMIVGGAELEWGASYALFLSRSDLPGARGVLTVRDHSQGAFDVIDTQMGLRVRSQAVGHPLLPDWRGESEAPGGASGFELNDFIGRVRGLAPAR